jgi:hypothetical protein
MGSEASIEAEYVLAGTRAEFRARLVRMASGADNASGYWFMMTSIVVAGLSALAWIGFTLWRAGVFPRGYAQS